MSERERENLLSVLSLAQTNEPERKVRKRKRRLATPETQLVILRGETGGKDLLAKLCNLGCTR